MVQTLGDDNLTERWISSFKNHRGVAYVGVFIFFLALIATPLRYVKDISDFIDWYFGSIQIASNIDKSSGNGVAPITPMLTTHDSSAQAATSLGNANTVLVAPFENLSGVQAFTSYDPDPGSDSRARNIRVDRYSEAPRSILEDIVFNLGGSPVERKRLNAIIQEHQFQQFANPNQAQSIGKLLGAQYLITGTIEKISTEKQTFSGYNINASNTAITVSLRIRMMDLQTGAVVFSRSLSGSQSYLSSKYGAASNSDIAYKIIEETLRPLEQSPELRSILTASRKNRG